MALEPTQEIKDAAMVLARAAVAAAPQKLEALEYDESGFGAKEWLEEQIERVQEHLLEYVVNGDAAYDVGMPIYCERSRLQDAAETADEQRWDARREEGGP